MGEPHVRTYERERIRLRAITNEEHRLLRQIWADTGLRLRLRMRAGVILAMADNPQLCAGRAGLEAGFNTRVPGIWWAKRFNAEGIRGLEDRPRPGPSMAFREERMRRREERKVANKKGA